MNQARKTRLFTVLFLSLTLLLTCAPIAASNDGFEVIAGDGVEAFVTRMYKYCLGRNPDPAGLKAYCDALRGGHITGGAATKSFFLSDEYKEKNHSNAQFLTTLYKAMFDREPDTGGFNGWMDAMNNGMSRPEVVDGFINSSEFVNLCMRYGITPYEGFVGTRWGALNAVCCKNGSRLNLQVSMDGSTRNSATYGCSSDPTWEGYAFTAPGSNKSWSSILQGCGVTLRGSGTWNVNFEANKCYVMMAQIKGSSVYITLHEVINCVTPSTSSVDNGYSLKSVDSVEIPITPEMDGLAGSCIE
jgi:hypothetical protein